MTVREPLARSALSFEQQERAQRVVETAREVWGG